MKAKSSKKESFFSSNEYSFGLRYYLNRDFHYCKPKYVKCCNSFDKKCKFIKGLNYQFCRYKIFF